MQLATTAEKMKKCIALLRNMLSRLQKLHRDVVVLTTITAGNESCCCTNRVLSVLKNLVYAYESCTNRELCISTRDAERRDAHQKSNFKVLYCRKLSPAIWECFFLIVLVMLRIFDSLSIVYYNRDYFTTLYNFFKMS